MSKNCIFCQIIAGKTPAEIVYQDSQVTAFRDRHPAARVHILIIPNQHIASLNDASEADGTLLGSMMTAAQKLAGQNQISQSGYRLILNTGPDAGQTVFHIHLHLLGGQPLGRMTR